MYTSHLIAIDWNMNFLHQNMDFLLNYIFLVLVFLTTQQKKKIEIEDFRNTFKNLTGLNVT